MKILSKLNNLLLLGDFIFHEISYHFLVKNKLPNKCCLSSLLLSLPPLYLFLFLCSLIVFFSPFHFIEADDKLLMYNVIASFLFSSLLFLSFLLYLLSFFFSLCNIFFFSFLFFPHNQNRMVHFLSELVTGHNMHSYLIILV